ncbi:FAD-dependent oxidoreductase [Lactococcus muris]|uniref:FAD-dependent oxidoreductase n=1 Tax=Lactococcus muris TaxID=2941330 RepID=A0ABV4D8N9_9LACT|nr:pyridine nucleotide-disulfide oxidoreductase [Lactococcus garvieae]
MERKAVKNLIIGFGKAGKTLAKSLARKGEAVAIVEQSPRMYGGTCINIGCIPSKSLIVNGQKGEKFADAALQKVNLVEKLNRKNYHMIADEPTATVIDGKARFLSDHEVEISREGQPAMLVEAERIFINTGARAILPSILGMSECKNLVTSTGLMDLQKRPDHLVIIGSGYIGLEFSSMFLSYGSRVTVIDSHRTFLPRQDRDIAARVKKDLEEAGAVFKLGYEINGVFDRDEKSILNITFDGQAEEVEADKILLATGRKPNISGLGLENTSVKIGEDGHILVNEKLETSAKNIWALGDVHGGPQFTYTSLDDYRIIESQLYGDKGRTLDNRGELASSVFITPTLSNVGLTETEAQAQRKNYRLFRLEATAIPKSAVLKQSKGLLKALVDPETEEILGATLYAEDSHEVINILSLAMKAKLPYTMIRDHIFTHPTMSEALNDLFSNANEVKK